MTRFLWIFLFLTAFAEALRAQSLIPKPVQATAKPGRFSLAATNKVSFLSPQIQSIASEFSRRLSVPTGLKFPIEPGPSGRIHFELFSPARPRLGSEGYQLEIDSGKITLAANDLPGLRYAMESLIQLLPPEVESGMPGTRAWSVPCQTITDYPRFGWRGMMLDVSRHFFTVEEVKRFIEGIARYKFNVFHWHLTDDHGWRIEIKGYPKLTSVGAWRVERSGVFGSRKPPQPGEPVRYGGFYTQEQIREVVSFAREKGVRIVPEIDIPGHCMAVLAAYPEFGCTKDTSIRVNPGSKFSEWYGNNTFKMLVENSLNPSDEAVYRFLDQVFTEVSALFPGEYIHVGGDECYKGFWAKDPGCRALMKKLKIRHVEDLQGYFMNRVKDLIQAKGKKVIGWDEVMEGGMSNEATVMFWRGWMQKEILPQIQQGNYKVIMSPTTTNYFDYYQGEKSIEPPVYAQLRLKDAYSFDPVPAPLSESVVVGGQSNLWTENMMNFRHVEYMTYPRAWATAEILWSPKGTQADWPGFVTRVEQHMKRAEKAGIRVAHSLYDPIVKVRREKGMMKVELSSEIPGVELYYTLDESMPDSASPRYQDPVSLPEGNVTLRVQAYRDGKPCGHLITLPQESLAARAR